MLPWILHLVGSVKALRKTPSIFIAVGSDLKPSDEQLLRKGTTNWKARLRRRATPGDGSGRYLRWEQPAGAAEGAAEGAAAAGAAGMPPHIEPSHAEPSHRNRVRNLTYTESALVDFAVCRGASWFVGWTSSSFSATLAYYRRLDSRPDSRLDSGPGEASANASEGGAGGGRGVAPHYYAYCAVGTRGYIKREESTSSLRMHTCRKEPVVRAAGPPAPP